MSTMSTSNFGARLTHRDGLYFAVTVFSTVGFGDITAKTEAARLNRSAWPRSRQPYLAWSWPGGCSAAVVDSGVVCWSGYPGNGAGGNGLCER
jgi:Ion channel